MERSAPGIFALNATGEGQGAILNQDGRINSPSNPADRRSVVVLFVTGEGQTNPPGVDGKPGAPPLPTPQLPVVVGIGHVGVEILYCGAAPGLVAGVMQVNVRVPVEAPSGNAVPVSIKIGDVFSPPGVTLAVR